MENNRPPNKTSDNQWPALSRMRTYITTEYKQLCIKSFSSDFLQPAIIPARCERNCSITFNAIAFTFVVIAGNTFFDDDLPIALIVKGLPLGRTLLTPVLAHHTLIYLSTMLSRVSSENDAPTPSNSRSTHACKPLFPSHRNSADAARSPAAARSLQCPPTT